MNHVLDEIETVTEQQPVPFLDRLLDAEATAAWAGIPVGTLMDKHRAGVLPGFAIGHKTLRWHPRSILVLLALEAGLSPQTIAATQGDAVTPTKTKP